MTAHDFRYSWMRLLTPDTASDYSNFFFSIQGAQEYWDTRATQLRDGVVLTMEEIVDAFNTTVGIRVINDLTIQIELVQQVPYFLDQLALAVCSPVFRPSVEGWRVNDATRLKMINNGWHTVNPPPMSDRRWISIDEHSGRIKQQYLWARPNSLIGNGPFVLSRWRYKRDMRLTRNPYYHDPALTTIDSIQAITIADANTAVLAFETGQVDWLSGGNVDYQSDMLDQKKAGTRDNIHAFPTFGTDFFSFNWDLKVVAEKLGHKGFDKYVDYPVDNKNYKGPDEGCYLKDYKLSGSDLQNDYSIPKLFSTAKYQPKRWQWLYWGSASTHTSMHLDTDESHAWLVPIIGYKYFWIYYKNTCLHTIVSPGDILYTPKNMYHAFVNLTSCLAITHNYKRKSGTPGLDIIKKFIAQIKL